MTSQTVDAKIASNADADSTTPRETTKVSGWKVDVVVVAAEKSDVLSTFAGLEPPPVVDRKDKKYFRSGTLLKIPGIPAELDRLSHLGRSDASDDANFYAEPRLVTHIDNDAIDALKSFYRERLKDG